MNTISERETRFQKINRAFIVFYCLFSAVLIVVYAIQKDGYHLGISLGTLVVPPAIALFYRILRLKTVHQLNFLVLAFTFLAYPLGSCLDFYRILPGFDKVAHTLSGVFVSLLCLVLYYALKPGHEIARKDAGLAMAFTFFGSMAVAGLWEVGEYLISFVVELDLQRVEATGVADSMQDMIVAMLGTFATLPFAHRLAAGKRDLITGAVDAFVALNLKG